MDKKVIIVIYTTYVCMAYVFADLVFNFNQYKTQYIELD